MCNPDYLYVEYPSSFISDGSCRKLYASNPDRFERLDDEIETIRTVLKKLTSIRIMNSSDVEDLVQDTLLTMISKHPGAELKKGPLIWSMGILRRKVGNYYRKAQRQAPIEQFIPRTRQWTSTASPEGTLFLEELKAIVGEVMTRIPPSQRQALELMMAGLNAREITEELHPVRYQNVINRLHRGRKKLAEGLARYGYGPEGTTSMRKMKPGRGNKSRESQKTSPEKPEDSASSGS